MTSNSTPSSVLNEHMVKSLAAGAPPAASSSQKKSTVAFVVWPQGGHIHPTLSLARRLQHHGHRVIYFSSARGAQIVQSQDFGCEVICPEPEVIGTMADAPRAECMEDLVNKFIPRLQAQGVDHLYCDAILFFAAFAGLRCEIDTQFFWPLEPPVPAHGHLPWGLTLHQHRSWRSRIAPRSFWKTPIAQSEVELAAAEEKGENKMHELLLRYTNEFKLSIIYSSIGYIPVLPGFMLAPPNLMPVRDKSLPHLGLSLDLERREGPLNFFPPGKSVYCTFGTNFMFYAQAEATLGRVIAAAARSPEISFLIQAPSGYTPAIAIPPNVQIIAQVPTLKVLQTVSAAIIHGGFGGIKECIYFQVPILVIPFYYDQPANAVIAEKNGIGISLAPEQATPEVIQNSLHKLIHRPSYRAALGILRSRCLAEDREDEWIENMSKRSASRPVSPAAVSA